MASSISAKLKFLLISLHIFSLAPFSFSNPNLPLDLKDGIHDLLPKYGLPIGLLPGNVKGYTLAPDKSFTVELTHHCYVNFSGHQGYFETHFKGKLDYGKVYDISGIQAKKLFFWVSITSMELKNSTNTIEFHAGPFVEGISADTFNTIPICRENQARESESASIWG